MKQRFIALLLAILCLLTALPAGAQTTDPPQDVPVVTSAVPCKDGVTLTWTSFGGAAQYYIFIQKSDGSWKVIGRSETSSFVHRLVPDNTAYLYTVRAADKNGAFISGFDRTGYAFACMPAPEIVGVDNTVSGQKFVWKSVGEDVVYRVYINSGSGWKAAADTTRTFYLNTDAVSGKLYAYTVRCFRRGAKTPCSYFDPRGARSTYIAAPKIGGFAPVKDGTSVRWKSVDGACRYGVFVKSAGKWKTICVTDDTSYSHRKLSDGVLYTYTVRCIDKKGNFCSGYDTVGTSCRYLAPPTLTSVKNRVLTWTGGNHAAGFRIFRKAAGQSWTAVGDSDVRSFTDTTAPKNTLCRYTVRCTDEKGRLNSYFIDNQLYYYNGSPAEGRISVSGKTLNFSQGRLRQGYVSENGKTYYFDASGVLQKNGLVGNSADGWRYADKNGVIDFNYTGLATNSAGTWYVYKGVLDRTARLAVTYGGVDYNVTKGKAHPVRTDEERTLFRALKLANRVAGKNLPKAQRLKLLWDYIIDAYEEMNPRLPDYTGMDWPVIYANDMLVYGRGNCLSYAAEYAYLAKAIGYDNVYACHSGGHGWAEIDGLVYDPEWARHSFHYSYYALSYSAHTDQDYRGAISPGYSWMHIKICPHL